MSKIELQAIENPKLARNYKMQDSFQLLQKKQISITANIKKHITQTTIYNVSARC